MLRDIIKVRSDPRLKAKVTAAAREQNKTVSELVRDALRVVIAPSSGPSEAAGEARA